jgi:glycerate 2-kinase
VSRFDPAVLGPAPETRAVVLELLEVGLHAVEPERLTADALASAEVQPTVVIAIGKAAPGMSRGAATVVDVVDGVCVSDHEEAVPTTMRLLLGDHPVPGPRSFAAGELILETVRATSPNLRLIALVSGGGSALCELARAGVTPQYLTAVNRQLMAVGAAIAEINLVRAHLSAIKCGGLSRAAGRPIDTFVISDVAGGDPWLVASGPTIPHHSDPDTVLEIMRQASIEVPPEVLGAISARAEPLPDPAVTLLADGSHMARAIEGVAPKPAAVRPGWLSGEIRWCLGSFLAEAGPGITIGVGEPVIEVRGDGVGGRNTHAALLAATMLDGSEDVFAAFATDGVDGNSGSAGAIVDGSTLSRGGDPTAALGSFDSAAYLSRTADLLICGPTGTNVSDIWILWRRGPT